MADSTQGWFISMTLIDGGLQKSVVTLELAGATAANAQTGASALVAAYQAITNSIVVGYHLINKRSVDGADPTTATGLNAIQAQLTASVYGNPLKSGSLVVVNPVVGVRQSETPGDVGYINVDLQDAALGTYVDLFKNAAGVGGALFSDGEKVLALTAGQIVTRGRRTP